ncbi:hypothetical protein HETIRDRAFT_426883 [Heterobasidion irregulare TC 32-1]|uniref:Uncharacterized protein n=1 Tax=Heterobasidion irregulare (strain TC 32-1) TaxID=747525 RepID=W4K8T9_HETIT|nr:uncharacterized protein HETIRDRAFT_426883 [Heterobasidion irregulare TC 32-1]ETW81481.1 hypothetical protein HETIRDRAFT_426883 [Heterobasidion irregulare TC 32-1]
MRLSSGPHSGRTTRAGHSPKVYSATIVRNDGLFEANGIDVRNDGIGIVRGDLDKIPRVRNDVKLVPLNLGVVIDVQSPGHQCVRNDVKLLAPDRMGVVIHHSGAESTGIIINVVLDENDADNVRDDVKLPSSSEEKSIVRLMHGVKLQYKPSIMPQWNLERVKSGLWPYAHNRWKFRRAETSFPHRYSMLMMKNIRDDVKLLTSAKTLNYESSETTINYGPSRMTF